MKIPLLCILFFLTLNFCGCNLFDVHPYDGHIHGEKNINAKNIARIEEACAGKKTIRFVTTGDTQRHLDDTKDFVKAINQRTDIDFVLHGGDVADFGLTKEFIWTRDILNKLNVPYVVLLGNHDCLANGEDIFKAIFGEGNFSFLAGNVKFVCLNTNAIEYNYSRPIPDFGFIKKEYTEQREGHEKTVVAMHARPGSEQFNNNVSELFQETIREKFPRLQFCLNAHDHNLEIEELFDDGIVYYGSPSIEKRSYLFFTITPDEENNTYDVVNF